MCACVIAFILFESGYMVSPLSILLTPLKTIEPCRFESVGITQRQRAHSVMSVNECGWMYTRTKKNQWWYFCPSEVRYNRFGNLGLRGNNDVIPHEEHILHIYAIRNNRKRPRVCTHASMDAEQLAPPPSPLNKQG